MLSMNAMYVCRIAAGNPATRAMEMMTSLTILPKHFSRPVDPPSKSVSFDDGMFHVDSGVVVPIVRTRTWCG